MALARKHGVAVVLAADSKYPQIADMTAAFVYARIMGTKDNEALGYSDAALDGWAERAMHLATGKVPDGLQSVTEAASDGEAKDVFLYVISGYKTKNPAAAMALIDRLR